MKKYKTWIVSQTRVKLQSFLKNGRVKDMPVGGCKIEELLFYFNVIQKKVNGYRLLFLVIKLLRVWINAV